jgi:type IV pilus assembly protein PilV
MKVKMIRSITPEGNKGFSLIEVLITIAIFAVGVLAVASMQYNSVRNTTSGNIMTQAGNLARAKMELLKNIPLTDPDLTEGDHLNPYKPQTWDPNNPIDADGNPGGIFTRTWVITLQSSVSRKIQVTVGWNLHGKSHSVVLTSISRGNGT